MKRIAIISDIHSNIHALNAVSDDMKSEGISEVWCLGDIVGYGVFPNECLEWIERNVSRLVLGNHELALLGLMETSMLNNYAQIAISWTRKHLKEKHIEFLMSKGLVNMVDSCELVHDTPENPGSTKYILTLNDARDALMVQERRLCFFGHTHIPVVYRLIGREVERIQARSVNLFNGRYLANPGSVGQPRDGNPKASYAIFEGGNIRFKRIRYDVKSAAKAILKEGLPKFLAARLLVGK